jgi:hypothetical protein
MTEMQFAICVKNDGFEASLQIRKIYYLISDNEAKSLGLLRVKDESGDDYLFPEDFFVPLDLPSPIQARLNQIT